MKRNARQDAWERFQKDVASHELRVERADGVHRCLLFRRPESGAYWFRLITWPGALAIDGDMGSHVFRRIDDMFEFFRGEVGKINAGYWSEKLTSSDRRSPGVMEFSRDLFVGALVRRVHEYFADGDKARQLRVWQAVREEIIDRLDGNAPAHAAHQLVYDFEHEGFAFTDFWETTIEDYTFHFLWNLHAIVWGIAKFDERQRAALIVRTPRGYDISGHAGLTS